MFEDAGKDKRFGMAYGFAFMKWQETKLDTAEDSKGFLRDTSNNIILFLLGSEKSEPLFFSNI